MTTTTTTTLFLVAIKKLWRRRRENEEDTRGENHPPGGGRQGGGRLLCIRMGTHQRRCRPGNPFVARNAAPAAPRNIDGRGASEEEEEEEEEEERFLRRPEEKGLANRREMVAGIAGALCAATKTEDAKWNTWPIKEENNTASETRRSEKTRPSKK